MKNLIKLDAKERKKRKALDQTSVRIEWEED